jgi:hypothetical protein
MQQDATLQEKLKKKALGKALAGFVETQIPRNMTAPDRVAMARGVDDTVRRLTEGRAQTCKDLKDESVVSGEMADFRRAVYDANLVFGVSHPKVFTAMMLGEINANDVESILRDAGVE